MTKTKPEAIKVPAAASKLFNDDAKHIAYFSPDTGELYVAMKTTGDVVDVKTLIEVLALVNPIYLKTIYVPSFAELLPNTDTDLPSVWSGDTGNFDLVEREFVVPASLFKDVPLSNILPTLPVAGTRWYEHDGKMYMIRDTVYGARIQCQYAVKGERGSVVWNDCRQGVEFAEIEPFAILPVVETVRDEAVQTEEAAKKIAIVSADYKEFCPDTLKGFVVEIGGNVSRFEHLNEAEYYAHINADRVVRHSSVDHYFFDKNFGDDSAEPIDAAEVRDDAVRAEEAAETFPFIPFVFSEEEIEEQKDCNRNIPADAVVRTFILEDDGELHLSRTIVDGDGRIRTQIGTTNRYDGTVEWTDRKGIEPSVPVVPQLIQRHGVVSDASQIELGELQKAKLKNHSWLLMERDGDATAWVSADRSQARIDAGMPEDKIRKVISLLR